MFGLKKEMPVESSIKKILLIEDDRMVSNLIKSFLEIPSLKGLNWM